jgi:hypothetical protein
MYLTCKIKLKTWKPVKSDLIRGKSVNPVRFYKFTKFVIWIKSGLNLTLKCLLTSFTRLDLSLKPSDQAEILQGKTGYMKLYSSKFSSQMEFGNIISEGRSY